MRLTRTWPLAVAAFACATAPTAVAGKPQTCAVRPQVTVAVAPLELSDPPQKPERLYPPAALRAGVSGRVTLECNAANGALAPCAVDEETPEGQGFAASAEKLAKTLVVRTAAVAQIVKVDVQFDIDPPDGCGPAS